VTAQNDTSQDKHQRVSQYYVRAFAKKIAEISAHELLRHLLTPRMRDETETTARSKIIVEIYIRAKSRRYDAT